MEAAVATPKPGEGPAALYRALYDYEGQADGDLAFKLLVLTNLSLVTWVARHYFSSKATPRLFLSACLSQKD